MSENEDTRARMSLIDEVIQWWRESHVKPEKDRVSYEQKVSNALEALICVWTIVGSVLTVFFTFAVSPWFLFGFAITAVGFKGIYDFGCWYDEKYEVGQ